MPRERAAAPYWLCNVDAHNDEDWQVVRGRYNLATLAWHGSDVVLR